MYLLTGGIKLVCTLSFTFEGNCGTNLKALLECMNRQYFSPFYTKIKKEKSKVLKSHIFVVGVWLHDFPLEKPPSPLPIQLPPQPPPCLFFFPDLQLRLHLRLFPIPSVRPSSSLSSQSQHALLPPSFSSQS